ncbi:MAG: CHAT domain-containing protein [Pseudanabaena sp. ELA607]
MNKTKILFLATNTSHAAQLALDEEIRAIRYKIRLSDYRDHIELIPNKAVRLGDLLDYLNEHKPQIVHFSGHGNETGEIILVDNDGKSNPVSKEKLQALFTTLKDNIKVIFLNACYSSVQGKAIAEIIDFVIGMDSSIEDEAAIEFSKSFYSAIGFGRTVQEAFEQGTLSLKGTPEEKTPQLIIREGADPSKKIVDPNILSDLDILKQHRIIFDRAAFCVSCIMDLSLRELSDAIDDVQAALNTGSLYSRSGNLLKHFPTKNGYSTDDFCQTFTEIIDCLTSLKRLLGVFKDTLQKINPNYDFDYANFLSMFQSIRQKTAILKAIKQMDNIDKKRNEILNRLNRLLQKQGEKEFSLIELSSDLIKNGKVNVDKKVLKYLQN